MDFFAQHTPLGPRKASLLIVQADELSSPQEAAFLQQLSVAIHNIVPS
jgi:hypothetical protein